LTLRIRAFDWVDIVNTFSPSPPRADPLASTGSLTKAERAHLAAVRGVVEADLLAVLDRGEAIVAQITKTLAEARR
jgi:hypothetical protein